MARASRSADAAASGSGFAASNGSASSAGSLHSCSPSLRQIRRICQRGSGSRDTTCPRCAAPPAFRKAIRQRCGQPVGDLPLLRAVRSHRPLRRGHVVAETNVGSPPMVSSRPGLQPPSTASPNAGCHRSEPACTASGSRVLLGTPYGVGELHRGHRRLGCPSDRGRGCRMRRGSQRNVALTGKQCRGWIEPDPAGAGM